MLSGTVPITKQLNSVTVRSVPAPAVIRPAGRYLKSSNALKNLPSQCLGSFSTLASDRAMRRHVSAFRQGERVDPDSGKHHLAHAVCCLLFMLENDIQESKLDEPLPAMLKRQAD